MNLIFYAVSGLLLALNSQRGAQAVSKETWFEASNDLWYTIAYNKMNHADATSFCESLGGILASVGMRDEALTNETLHAFLGKTLPTDQIWIGLTDDGTNKNWMWADGVPATLDKTAWDKPEEPDDLKSKCGLISPFEGHYPKLDDSKCGRKNFFMCETPACKCLNGGSCSVNGRKATCDCVDGFSGSYCQTKNI